MLPQQQRARNSHWPILIGTSQKPPCSIKHDKETSNLELFLVLMIKFCTSQNLSPKPLRVIAFVWKNVVSRQACLWERLCHLCVFWTFDFFWEQLILFLINLSLPVFQQKLMIWLRFCLSCLSCFCCFVVSFDSHTQKTNPKKEKEEKSSS